MRAAFVAEAPLASNGSDDLGIVAVNGATAAAIATAGVLAAAARHAPRFHSKGPLKRPA